MAYQTIAQALADCFNKPLNKLSREKRVIAEAYIKSWASLSAADREKRAIEVDRQRALKRDIKFDRALRKQEEESKTPLGIAGKIIDWWNNCLDAAAWWEQDSVKFRDAAMLLCCHNPRDQCTTEEEVERTTMFDDTSPKGKTRNITPADYRRLRDAFDAQVHTTSYRNLAYWLEIAQKKNLRYHGWIDQWLKAREIIAVREEEPNANSNAPQAAPAESEPQSDSVVIEHVAPHILDGEPSLQPGKNNRADVDKWVKWQAPQLKADDDNGDELAERIKLLAEKRGYESERKPLSIATIISNALCYRNRYAYGRNARAGMAIRERKQR